MYLCKSVSLPIAIFSFLYNISLMPVCTVDLCVTSDALNFVLFDNKFTVLTDIILTPSDT